MKTLRQLRERKGFTQQQIGDLLGVSRQAICDYEKGRYAPSMKDCKVLAEAYGVSLEDISKIL